jgi:hypothetical protein
VSLCDIFPSVLGRLRSRHGEEVLGERSRSSQLRLADDIGERVSRGWVSLARRVLKGDGHDVFLPSVRRSPSLGSSSEIPNG